MNPQPDFLLIPVVCCVQYEAQDWTLIPCCHAPFNQTLEEEFIRSKLLCVCVLVLLLALFGVCFFALTLVLCVCCCVLQKGSGRWRSGSCLAACACEKAAKQQNQCDRILLCEIVRKLLIVV